MQEAEAWGGGGGEREGGSRAVWPSGLGRP
jgi:hypothetical protein